MKFDEVMSMAEVFVASKLFPDIESVEQAATIIMAGTELGLPPVRALRSLSIVRGKIAENADSCLARFKTEGGRAEWVTLNDTTAVLRLAHPNGDQHEAVYTLEMAKKAGIANHMYQKHPKAMLRSRAITSGLKDLGWGGAAAVYAEDELDTDPAPGVPAPPPQATPLPSMPTKEELAVPMPPEGSDDVVARGHRVHESTEEEAPPTTPAVEYEVISKPQLAGLMACCDDNGISEDAIRAYIKAKMNVESRKDIPKAKLAELRKRIKAGTVAKFWEQQNG